MAHIMTIIHKRVFTPLRGIPTRVIEAVNQTSTQQWQLLKMLRLDVKFSVNAVVEFKK